MKYFLYQHSFTSLLGPYGHPINEEMARAHLIKHGEVLLHFITNMKVHGTGINKCFRQELECFDGVLCSIVTPALMVRIFHLKMPMVYEIIHM